MIYLKVELFGHVKGAFTGAINDRIGRFQHADGGTIFLDEIGDISKKMQLRLLRVLETMEFERVGDSKTIKVDVRVIAATNTNLPQQVKRGNFREDLFHRLAVVELNLPSLRNRKEDIPALINHFVDTFNKKFKKDIKGVSVDVQEAFLAYHWPGNIRELKHKLEHAFVLCKMPVITMGDVPSFFKEEIETDVNDSFEMTSNDLKNIKEALEKVDGNKSKAARLLGINRKTLYRRMEKYKI